MTAHPTLLLHFACDRRGLAALEFALIAPMMIVLLFGSVELTELLATDRRAANTAASVADVISRDTVIEDAEINDLWTAANALMYPNSATPLQIRISSVQVETATQAKVLWSDGHNGYSPRAAGSAMSLPAGMMIPGTSVVVSETTYHYTPPIGVFLDLAFDLDHIEYRRPRVADPVTRN
ncbi:MAG: pilus assembly protein [Hyphomonadaceae bacterium]|nr:MAG: TadE family protein [Caulobacteraceae bacterium]MBT9447003.1 pilus assembly protein [Hyphomonadaceae bacterium]TPW08812.1 MAG: TadE family protein [Alphaproteobacteria bacterium]